MLVFFIASLLILWSAQSFWVMWLGLEMMNFILIPWMMEGSNLMLSSKIFKYFIIQMIASCLFFISVTNLNNEMFLALFVLSMVMKLGSFPFHLWVINLVEGMIWKKFMFIMTIAKMGGLLIMMSVNPVISLIYPTMLGVLTPLSGLKSSSLRKMMSFSSVSHMSWLFVTMCLSFSLFFLYFSLYWLVFLTTCLIFKHLNLSTLKDMFSSVKFTFWKILSILGLMGFPPLVGFFPKLMTLKYMTKSFYVCEAIGMGVASVLPFFFYLKMIMNMFLSYGHKNLSFIMNNMASTNIISIFVLLMFTMDCMLMLMI